MSVYHTVYSMYIIILCMYVRSYYQSLPILDDYGYIYHSPAEGLCDTFSRWSQIDWAAASVRGGSQTLHTLLNTVLSAAVPFCSLYLVGYTGP